MVWGIQRRFTFIEMRLYWEGKINRKDLVDFFGISIPQASTDLRNYSEQAPDNIAYDKSNKQYFATPSFDPLYISGVANEYLYHLLLSNESNFGESFLGAPLPLYQLPYPGKAINAGILRKIVHAYKNEKALKVYYQSMSKPDPIWRWITPHALGFDGYRWHVRAYCHRDSKFKDFSLGRILDSDGEREHRINFSSDVVWNNSITFKIVPHPGLSENQQKAIQVEYGMKDGTLQIEVKAAFVFYMLKRLRFDEKQEEREPVEQQIILANLYEVVKAGEIFEKMKIADI